MTTATIPPPSTTGSSRRPTTHHVTLTAQAPIHHGAFGADAGNVVLFRRVPVASDPTGRGIPVVSGNALRGRLRRIVMRDLLDRCELSRTSDRLTPSQWDKLYAALANGGHLTGSETTVKPEDRRALREAVPALSVFGASLYTFMLPGRISVGWLYPVCRESIAEGLVAPRDQEVDVTAEELVTEVSQVRHIDRDEQNPDTTGVTPMPVTMEALVPGTVLESTVIAQAAMTSLEWGAVGWGLRQLVSIGGKDGSGFGRVSVGHDVPDEAIEAYEADRLDLARVEIARVALLTLASKWV